MSEEVKKYIKAVEEALLAAGKDFVDNEEVRGFFAEQAKLQGKVYFKGLVATDPAEKKILEDDLDAIVGQSKSEVARLALAADDLVRAQLEGAVAGVGKLLVSLLRGNLSE